MDDKTYQELQGIQSALNNQLIMKSELNHTSDDSEITGNRSKFKKPLSCAKCGKSFTSKSKLETHERVHTSEKPFCCLKCDKAFSQSECKDGLYQSVGAQSRTNNIFLKTDLQ